MGFLGSEWGKVRGSSASRGLFLKAALVGFLVLLFCAGSFAQGQGQDQPQNQQQDSQQNPPSQEQQPPAKPDAGTEDQSQPSQDSSQKPSAGQPPADQSPGTSSSDKSPSDKSKGDADKDEKKDDNPNPAAAVVEKTKEAAQQTLTKVRDWETEWVVGAYVGRNRKLVPLSTEAREDLYLKQTFLTPGAYLKRMASAGFDQARGTPSQWDGGVKGYLERWGSREGQFIAANSLAAAGNAALHYEPRYDQCRCQGFWPRTRHALVRNFLTYNQTESELRPQWALFGGAFGGGMISDAWKPKPRSPWAEGARGMLGQAVWGTVQNFFNEFAVDINRKLGAQK